MKRIAVGLLVCLATSSAWADSLSTARLWNFTATLTDLDPFDGIDPAIVFDPTDDRVSTAAATLFEHYAIGAPFADEQIVAGNGPFSPVTATATSPSGHGSATVSGSGTSSSTVLDAAGLLTTTPGTSSAYFVGASMLLSPTNTYLAEAFSITPRTRVVFAADVDLFADLVYPEFPVSVAGYDVASASARIYVFEQGEGPNPGAQSTIDEAAVSQNTDSYLEGPGSSLQTRISVQFENTTSQSLSGAIGVSADVSGQSRFPPAIPEPESWALFAAGGAVIAWRLSGRRSSRSQRGAMQR